MSDCDSTGTAERSYPTSEVGEGGAAERIYPASEVRGSDERSYNASEVRGGGREELPHTPTPQARGSGQEEQANVRGQGQWPGGPTPHCGCMGTGGPEELSNVEGQEGQR